MSTNIFMMRGCSIHDNEFSNFVMNQNDILDLSKVLHTHPIIKTSTLPTVSNYNSAIEYLMENTTKSFNIYFVEMELKGMIIDYSQLADYQDSKIITTPKELDGVLSQISNDEKIIFIDCFSGENENIITFCKKYWLNLRDNNLYYFNKKNESVNLLKIIQEYLFSEENSSEENSSLFAKDFNPFTKFNIIFEDYSSGEKKEYISFIETLVFVLEKYVSYGFHENENDVPSKTSLTNFWVFNLNIFPIKSLISYFNLYSPYEDRRNIPIDEFIINKEHRRLITEYLCKVVVNIVIESDFPIKLPGKIIRNKESVRNWYDPSFIANIHSFILEMNNRE